MGNELISDEDVQKALDFLRDSVPKAAAAKAMRVQLEESRKSLKAIIMKEHADLPLAAQEREAYADDRYKNHIEAIRQAVQDDETFRLYRVAAEAKIEAWRTMSSNYRSMKI